MSSVVDAIYELKYNPFEYSHYIASFYSRVCDVKSNLLLSPLVIPLCSHPEFGRKLYNSNIRSSLWSIFQDRAEIYDLQERIAEFRSLTELCIQYCLAKDWVFVDEDNLSLRFCVASDSSFSAKKSAEKLGRIFNSHSAVEIYAFLGVRPR